MSRNTAVLQDNLAVHLSSDNYDLVVVHGNRQTFKISSEEKISFLQVFPTLKRSYMEKNTTVNYHFVLLVDTTLGWALYCIKSLDSEGPAEMYRGKFMSENQQLNTVKGVHEVNGRLLVIFDQFHLAFIQLPKQLKPGKSLVNKQFLGEGAEPTYQHQPFSSLKGFLPNEEEYDISCTFYSDFNQEMGLLFAGLKSRTDDLSSIYTMEMNLKKDFMLSGRNVLLNLKGTVRAILPTAHKDVYLVQTTSGLVSWNISVKDKSSEFKTYSTVLVSTLTPVASKRGIKYAGITSENKLVILSVSPDATISIQQGSIPGKVPLDVLQCFINENTKEHYIFTRKEELFLVSQTFSHQITHNQHTTITSGRLAMAPTHNFLLVEKQRGTKQERVLFGHHLFAYDVTHNIHGLMLTSANFLRGISNNQESNMFLTSPLIGLIELKLSRTQLQGKQKDINLPKVVFECVLGKGKQLMNAETLFLNERYQITAQEVLQQTKKAVRVQKLFENTIEYISNATVLGSQLVILSVSEQVHIFDQKLKRKYIYCFNHEIKHIYSLNDVNVIGVELYPSEDNLQGNQLTILILEQDKAINFRTVTIPDSSEYIQLSTVINTTDYKLNLFGNKMVICSNDNLHKFQIDKIKIEEFQLPLPTSNLKHRQMTPLLSLGSKSDTPQFIVIFREEATDLIKKFDQVEVFIGSFSNKYLLNTMQLSRLHLNYQKVLTLSELPRDFPLAAVISSAPTGPKELSSIRHLTLLGQKYLSLFSLKVGKIQLEWLEDRKYLDQQLEKVESIPQSVIKAGELLPIDQPLSIVSTSKKQLYLLANSHELYYAGYQQSKLQTISYYSLINDDFGTFRNNLALSELNDVDFMGIFRNKMKIKGVKYLNDQTIFVLFQNCIIVLEIGVNSSLVVRQQIKFQETDSTDVIKIQQFLQNYDEESVYLKESQGRIYLLKSVEGSYKIVFHSHADEDVLLFSRLSRWHSRDRTHWLVAPPVQKAYEELVLKKDGQLIVDSVQGRHEANRLTYL